MIRQESEFRKGSAAFHKQLPISFLTEGLYRHALDHGLQPTVDRLVAEVIRRNLDENDGNKSKTQRDLKISTRLFYSTIRKQKP
ncbi:MAG: hypothetical protein ABIK28_17940 [Planctomycetota bacterium]